MSRNNLGNGQYANQGTNSIEFPWTNGIPQPDLEKLSKSYEDSFNILRPWYHLMEACVSLAAFKFAAVSNAPLWNRELSQRGRYDLVRKIVGQAENYRTAISESVHTARG